MRKTEEWSKFACSAMRLGGGRTDQQMDAENIYIAELIILTLL